MLPGGAGAVTIRGLRDLERCSPHERKHTTISVVASMFMLVAPGAVNLALRLGA